MQTRRRIILLSITLGVSLAHAFPLCEPAVKVNLNTATVTTLMHTFRGIGKQRAEAIVRYRDTHGGFNAVAELALVNNIGLKFTKLHLLELEAVFTI